MKVARSVVDARRRKLSELISSHHYLPVPEVCRQLGISEATARRDLAALAKQGTITRTHGGAVLDFNERFPSYIERQTINSASKRLLAAAAVRLIRPGWTIFCDSGTTLSYLADALVSQHLQPLKVLTVNLPVAELLSPLEGLEVFLTGGRMLARQSALLGEGVLSSIHEWHFDLAFLSAEGATSEGLWNSHPDIVAHQRAAVTRARRHIFLMDHSKIKHPAAEPLLSWHEVDTVLTDASSARCRSLGANASNKVFHPDKFAVSELDLDPAPADLPVHIL